MQEIWFFYKLIEVLLGIICMTFHFLGFVTNEPTPHNLFYCGTFSSFAIYSFFGMLNICWGAGRSELMEAIPATLGALTHIGASLLLMYHAEQDFHLMFFTDYEEPLHEFFFYCKAQSITALATGGMYMLHATFAFDAVFIKDQPKRRRSLDSMAEGEDEDDEEIEESEMALRHRKRIELFVLGKWMQGKLMNWKWFQKMAMKP